MNILTRFENKYIPEPNSGCWLWLASVKGRGYGVFHVPREDKDYRKSHTVSAHIFSYRLFKGPTNGLHVCHTCDMPCCVNPDHLFLGTCLDNIADREKKGRGGNAVGEAHGMATLTSEIVKAIRADDRATSFIVNQYGINPATVRKIKRRLLWAHLL